MFHRIHLSNVTLLYLANISVMFSLCTTSKWVIGWFLQVFSGNEYHSLGSLSDDVPVLSCSGLTKRYVTYIYIHINIYSCKNRIFNAGKILAIYSLKKNTSVNIYIKSCWKKSWQFIHEVSACLCLGF